MTLWLVYPLIGSATGLLAGLLGLGGGVIVVPALLAAFSVQGVAGQHSMQLALGTSLATICFTSLSSVRAHHRRGAVDFGIVRGITPGILAGSFGGSWAAAALPGQLLKAGFAVFLCFVCVRMLTHRERASTRGLPGFGGMTAVGLGIGALSAIVGIGGGTLTIPFMTRCGVPMHRAVGTSAAIGFPIALAGALGYIVNGLAVAGLPTPTFGYVYLPALAGIALASVLVAPLGARLAHALPVAALRRIFALLLLVVAARLLFGAVREAAVSSASSSPHRDPRFANGERRPHSTPGLPVVRIEGG